MRLTQAQTTPAATAQNDPILRAPATTAVAANPVEPRTAAAVTPAMEVVRGARAAAATTLCASTWEEMPGSGRVRSCGGCGRKVYNLRGLSAAEAIDLLRRSEGRLRIPSHRRGDGTYMTVPCPTVHRAQRRRTAAWVASGFLAVGLGYNLLSLTQPYAERPPLARLLTRDDTPPRVSYVNPVAAAENAVEIPQTPQISEPAAPVPVDPTVRAQPPAVPFSPDPTVAAPADKPFLNGADVPPPEPARADPFVAQRSTLHPHAAAAADTAAATTAGTAHP